MLSTMTSEGARHATDGDRVYTDIVRSGWITVARRVGVHWTVPVSALLLGGPHVVPVFWGGVLLVLLVHEMGHVAVVGMCGLRVSALEIHGLGGRCRWEGHASPLMRSTIAWGGMAAQMLVFGITLAAFGWHGMPSRPGIDQLVHALLRANLLIAAINLVPLGSLDGAEAWRAIPRFWRRWQLRNHPYIWRKLVSDVTLGTAERAPSNVAYESAEQEVDLMATIERTQPEVSREADSLIAKVVDRAVVEMRHGRRRR